jgi:uncharacterized protein (DUF2236 family)
VEAPADNRVDEGYFGPDSIAWKVHSHPIVVVGGFRALMIQALHPLAMAGVTHYSDFKNDPLRRFRVTARFVNSVVFDDTPTVDKHAARVRMIHDKVRGIDSVTGEEYVASDPRTLLWVHCVEAHSFMDAYRTFAGPMSEAEQDRYLTEYVKAGELVGIPRTDIPATRAEYREYFARVFPELRRSEVSDDTVEFVANPKLRLVPKSEWPFAINLKIAGNAAVSRVPLGLRPLMNLPEPGAREWVLERATKVNGTILGQALKFKPVQSVFDGVAQKKLGMTPLPDSARR